MKIFALAFCSLVVFPPVFGNEAPDSRIRVAIYKGPGVGGSGPEVLKESLSLKPLHFIARYISPEDIREGVLDEIDVVVFPGGSGSRQAAGLGSDGAGRVKTFVRDGGGYVGICAGCYLACENFSWSLKILDAKTKSSKWRRGIKPLELSIESELLGVEQETITIKYANGPVMEPADSPDLPDYTTLAIFKTETAENESPPGIQVGTPAILSGTFGKGRVVGISPHPEQTDGFKGLVPRLIQWCAGDEPTHHPTN